VLVVQEIELGGRVDKIGVGNGTEDGLDEGAAEDGLDDGAEEGARLGEDGAEDGLGVDGAEDVDWVDEDGADDGVEEGVDEEGAVDGLDEDGSDGLVGARTVTAKLVVVTEPNVSLTVTLTLVAPGSDPVSTSWYTFGSELATRLSPDEGRMELSAAVTDTTKGPVPPVMSTVVLNGTNWVRFESGMAETMSAVGAEVGVREGEAVGVLVGVREGERPVGRNVGLREGAPVT
jgi:hypothetical protein